MTVKIRTTLDEKTYEEIKKRGLHFSSLIKRGLSLITEKEDAYENIYPRLRTLSDMQGNIQEKVVDLDSKVMAIEKSIEPIKINFKGILEANKLLATEMIDLKEKMREIETKDNEMKTNAMVAPIENTEKEQTNEPSILEKLLQKGSLR